jgi:hypothetical protein
MQCTEKEILMNKIRFPYGKADFYRLIGDGNYYVDRTAYIRLLEDKGDTLLFLRPRRFGKSLFLSMLENYYDVNKTAEFERLFGHLSIGQNPTPLHNRYLILRWNFSMVASHETSQDIKQSLYNHLNRSIQHCARRHANQLVDTVVIDSTDGLNTFQSLLDVVSSSPLPLYLLIDEYDNFANEVLMASQSGSQERYQDLVEGEGLLKSVFKVVKAALEGQGLERVFITGVSPVVVNDLTSGFNVVKNITLDENLHAICGFTEAEVAKMLDHVAAVCQLTPAQTDEAMMMMRTFYNGYRFSLDDDIRLYNPMLVFYFLDQFQDRCRFPRKMLDNNLATDQQKIHYVAHIPHGGSVISTALSDTEPLVVPELAERFGVRNILYGDKDDPFMASLLYYLGVLTLSNTTPLGKRILTIPNLVTRKLYAEQIKEMLLPFGTRNDALKVAEDFYSQGNIGAVCEFIERTYLCVFDNRDYRWVNELTIKTMFLSLLFDDLFYIVDSEASVGRRYADLVMILRPDMRKYALYDFVVEFKQIELGKVKMSGADVHAMAREELAALPLVAREQAAAREQLAHYRQMLEAMYGERLKLRCFSVVAIGYERFVWEEVPNTPGNSDKSQT